MFLQVDSPPKPNRQNRTVIIRSLVAFDHWTDSLGGRRGAPYPDTFFLDAPWLEAPNKIR